MIDHGVSRYYVLSLSASLRVADRHVGEAALLQKQGQNLYGQGNWEAAVKAFTEVFLLFITFELAAIEIVA
jgi:Flp pilus assembly protein TadD